MGQNADHPVVLLILLAASRLSLDCAPPAILPTRRTSTSTCSSTSRVLVTHPVPCASNLRPPHLWTSTTSPLSLLPPSLARPLSLHRWCVPVNLVHRRTRSGSSFDTSGRRCLSSLAPQRSLGCQQDRLLAVHRRVACELRWPERGRGRYAEAGTRKARRVGDAGFGTSNARQTRQGTPHSRPGLVSRCTLGRTCRSQPSSSLTAVDVSATCGRLPLQGLFSFGPAHVCSRSRRQPSYLCRPLLPSPTERAALPTL